MQRFVIRGLRTTLPIVFFLIVAVGILHGAVTMPIRGFYAYVSIAISGTMGVLLAFIFTGALYLLLSINDHLSAAGKSSD